MTDGIIQKVISNYYDDNFFTKEIGKRFNEILDEVKKELIEEIKKFSEPKEVWGYERQIIDIEELIGDTK